MPKFDIVCCFPGFEQHAEKIAKLMRLEENIVRWDEFAMGILSLPRFRGVEMMDVVKMLNHDLTSSRSLFDSKTFIVNQRLKAHGCDTSGLSIELGSDAQLKPSAKMTFIANAVYQQTQYDHHNREACEFTNVRARSAPTGTVVKIKV